MDTDGKDRPALLPGGTTNSLSLGGWLLPAAIATLGSGGLISVPECSSVVPLPSSPPRWACMLCQGGRVCLVGRVGCGGDTNATELVPLSSPHLVRQSARPTAFLCQICLFSSRMTSDSDYRPWRSTDVRTRTIKTCGAGTSGACREATPLQPPVSAGVRRADWECPCFRGSRSARRSSLLENRRQSGAC
jgi:hypothetical protein